ncbi:MAG: hypothetical protein QOG31_309 [Thermoplasmata archaeon]|jgi:hypothetical protein|nr:hypothetical protein [Thermoplasmata archaeon]
MRLHSLLFAGLAVLPLLGLSLAPLQHAQHAAPDASAATSTRQSPLRAMAEQYASAFPADPIPAGLSAQQRMDYLLNGRPCRAARRSSGSMPCTPSSR